MINHVVSLETAKKLKDYLPEGWRGNLYWFIDNRGNARLTDYLLWHGKELITQVQGHRYEVFRAPTLSEMLGLMPKVIDGKWELTIISNNIQMAFGYKHITKTFYDYGKDSKPFFTTPIEDFKPEEAAGQLLLWCGEQGHLTEGKDDS